VDVILGQDGVVEVHNGAQDIGTGTKTVLAVIVAEELGLDPAKLVVRMGDTQLPPGPGSGGSTTAPSVGPAARNAGAAARKAVSEAAAKKLGCGADAVKLAGGKVTGGGRSMTFAEACRLLPEERVRVSGQREANYRTYRGGVAGCQFAEVEVDVDTGHVKPIKIVAIQDAGRVISKLTFESQVLGGVIQGISYALYEDRLLDRNAGTQVNADFLNYKIAGAADMPEIVPVAFSVANAGNNCGMAGLGEPPTIPTAAAIANAVFNATGARMRSLPITPARMLAALSKKGG
jgi:xanthine dehydrogenase YagR molybdenum-binding subunit